MLSAESHGEGTSEGAGVDPLCCWLTGLAFLLTPHPQIITLTLGFGGGEDCGSWQIPL